MARPSNRMVDVELVEDGQGEPDAESSRRARTLTPARRRSLAAAAVVVVGAVSAWSLRTDTVVGSRDDALLAAYADVPGIAPSLREPLTSRSQLAAPGSVVGGLVIGQEDADGGRRTVARDAGTGKVRWVAPESVDVAGRGTDCSATAARGSLLLCQVHGEPGQGGPTTDAVLGGTPDRLVVLRAEDGQVVAERELGPTAIGWTVLDEDVVIATRDGATAYVERSSLLGSRPLWRSEIPLPRDVLARQMRLVADDGLVVLTGPVAGVLDGETGSLLGTWMASGGSRVPVQVVTSSIGFAVWTAPQEGIWFDRTGAAGARLPGAPVVATVDDGSTPRVMLLQDAQILRAVDVYEGVLWERPRVQHASIRMDGRVVLEDGGVLRATDVVSGEDLWSVQPGIASVAGTPVLTDGVRFLVAGHPASAEQVVTAYNLRDGSQEWTTSLAGQRLEVPVGSGLPERPGDEVAVFD